MAAVQRVVAVDLLPGLFAVGQAGVEDPAVGVTADTQAGCAVDVDRGEEGQPPLPVHHHAEVVIVQHVRLPVRLPVASVPVERRQRDEIGGRAGSGTRGPPGRKSGS